MSDTTRTMTPYEEEMDKIISKELRDEVAPIIQEALSKLRVLKYLSEYGEGGAVLAEKLMGYLARQAYRGELPNSVFRDSDALEERISPYGVAMLKVKKLEVFRRMMTPPKKKP